MKEIIVLSGKGGTGKTSIVGSLAVLAENKVLVDCDVDAADLHLLFQPAIREKHDFRSGQTALINEDKCIECGLCQEVCRFNAIKNYIVMSTSCEGCGFCARVCPTEAITMSENVAGQYFISDTKYGPLVHAMLGIAQENSGKLVALVRQKARELAEKQGAQYIICDGPPGIGCPVISSLSGASLALLVTEPTLSGIHDLERVLGVCQHFSVPAIVCINKYDINEENTCKIENFCLEQQVDVAAKIPFDKVVTEAMVRGLPIVQYSQGKISRQINTLWQNIVERLNHKQEEHKSIMELGK
jgi:MinD superfamily P-loop ATPase